MFSTAYASPASIVVQIKIWEQRPECLKLLSMKHEMMLKKPDSMVSIYNVLDGKQEALQIAGKDVILCVSKGKATSSASSIDSLKAPTNIIQPTKKNEYQHNTQTNHQAVVDADELLISKKLN